MSWPFTFGTATSPVAASHLDDVFNQIGSGMALPCSALGTNVISLTPLAGFPALSAYTELCGYRFRAASSSAGLVTLQYNGLAILPVYHADGVTQVSTGDVVAGFEYVARFSQGLNSGTGGFFLESPALPTAATNWSTPGGRLTIVPATPVPFTNQATTGFYYVPYVHAFCPIYNGTSIQTVQFTSALSDANGLTLSMAASPATWPAGNCYDVFMTLIGGVPTLCTVAWTNLTTRALTLAVWGGFLTNNSSTTAQTATGPITLPVHQGTFLGSFVTSSNGILSWTFGAAASGGTAASFGICNYYNKVLFGTVVSDNGGVYTYTAGVARQVRNSSNMQINYVQSDSERAVHFQYASQIGLVPTAGAQFVTGIGFDSTTIFGGGFFTAVQAANLSNISPSIIGAIFTTSAVGFHFATAIEQGDGGDANSNDVNNFSQLRAAIWL